MSDRRHRDAPVLSKRHAVAGERRNASRYETKGTAAFIGWSEQGEYRTVAATLIDISMGGFSAWIKTVPPPAEDVWLRLDGEDPPRWIKAHVVAMYKTGCLSWARRRVRLRFLEPCPYDFFKAAIEGFTREVTQTDNIIEKFHSRFWR
jgi:hypothetical protein